MEEKIIEEIIKEKSSILIYISDSGETLMLTTGEINKQQTKILQKIITVLDDHSLILKIVLGIEIFFNNLQEKIKEMFKK